VAIATVTPAVSPTQLTVITSEEISRYAEITSQLSQLEAQQKALRAELLEMHVAGAEQETTSPYLLAFVDQVRCFATGDQAVRHRESRAVEAESRSGGPSAGHHPDPCKAQS
jgi:hypothetical protein